MSTKALQDSATAREMFQVILPLAIGKSLLAVSSKDIYRPTIEKTVGVFNDDDKTVLVATDTHTMMVATAPNKLDIPNGNYKHEITPAPCNGKGRMLLSVYNAPFPNYASTVSKFAPLVPIGSLNTHFGKLETCKPVCIDYRKFAPLCPGIYELETVDREGDGAYLFTCKYDDWSLTYVIMPMTRAHDGEQP